MSSCGLCAPVPNAPSKISVPLINSLPGKNCLVPLACRKACGAFALALVKSKKAAASGHHCMSASPDTVTNHANIKRDSAMKNFPD